MKTNHTPGKWESFNNGRYIEAITKEGRIRICNVLTLLWSGNSKANARLIAAAPELLEACKESLLTEKILMENNSALRSQKVIDKLKNAIAKAEGGEDDS